MTLGAIVIPLRLKPKIFPPGQACIVFPRDWFLCFMGDESVDTLRSLGDTGNLSLARRQGCQHPSQRGELMWKPARKPMSRGSSWEHSLCFRKRTEKSWSRVRQQVDTPAPRQPHHCLLRLQGPEWTFPSCDRSGAGPQTTQFPTTEHAFHLLWHASCYQMTCIN